MSKHRGSNGNCLQRLVVAVAAFIVGILLAVLLSLSTPYFLKLRQSVLDTVFSLFDGK